MPLISSKTMMVSMIMIVYGEQAIHLRDLVEDQRAKGKNGAYTISIIKVVAL